MAFCIRFGSCRQGLFSCVLRSLQCGKPFCLKPLTLALFRGSPLFEAIDFLDRLAPFSDPTLVLTDETPRFEPQFEDEPWPM